MSNSRSASLDTLEIPVADSPATASSSHAPDDWTLPQPFKHRGWKPYRDRIYRTLIALDVSPARRRRFAGCGSSVWLLVNREDPALFKVVYSSCHDRFCLPCSRARATNIRNNLANYTQGLKLRFVTLTLAHTSQPLAVQLDRLVRAFKSLRGTPLWRQRVRGGVAFLEVKLSDRTGCWHPHFHVLIDSNFLPQSVLSALWLDVTGDSKIVDIRLVRGQEEVAQYVTKYVTKPLSGTVLRDAATTVEAVSALHNRRLFIAFGGWVKWKLTQNADPKTWDLFAHESELFQRSKDGDPFADAIIQHVLAFFYADGDSEFRVEHVPLSTGPPAGAESRQRTLW